MTIVIVEDHVMFRDVIRKVCVSQFGHQVIGETSSGVEAVQSIKRLQPDVVILDLSLADMDGFRVIDQISAPNTSTKFLVVSSHCDDYTLFRVEKAGVQGFVDKNTSTIEALQDALTAIGSGRVYFSPTFQAAKLARRNDPRSFTKVLSEWERAILSLIGQGLSDEEIAERLNKSPRTIQTHRSHMMQKLDCKGTPKLIAFAIEHGFTQIQSKTGSNPVFS